MDDQTINRAIRVANMVYRGVVVFIAVLAVLALGFYAGAIYGEYQMTRYFQNHYNLEWKK